jgi:hypothetical protein
MRALPAPVKREKHLKQSRPFFTHRHRVNPLSRDQFLTFDNQTLPKALSAAHAESVSELTPSAGIQLNERVSLPRDAKTIA